MKRLLAFSGSSRLHSINQALLQAAIRLAESKGATVDVIDLKALGLPLYDGDLEAASGLPQGAKDLKAAMQKADGFLITSPEYNSFPSPLLLNAIDWASRAEAKDEPPLVAFKGKTAGLLATSPGPMGGQRSLVTLRDKLQNIGVTVAPVVTAVGKGSEDLFQDPDFLSTSNGQRVEKTVSALLSLEITPA